MMRLSIPPQKLPAIGATNGRTTKTTSIVTTRRWLTSLRMLLFLFSSCFCAFPAHGQNQFHGRAASAPGGEENTANGNFSVVSGGFTNVIIGDATKSGIHGGEFNKVLGSYSFIGEWLVGVG